VILRGKDFEKVINLGSVLFSVLENRTDNFVKETSENHLVILSLPLFEETVFIVFGEYIYKAPSWKKTASFYQIPSPSES
jgi:hypothetical protein